MHLYYGTKANIKQVFVSAYIVVILLLLLRTCILRPQALCSSLEAKVKGSKKRRKGIVLSQEAIIVAEMGWG